VAFGPKAVHILNAFPQVRRRRQRGRLGQRPSARLRLPGREIRTAPVLIVAGDQDQIIPPDKASTLAAAIKTATLAIIEHAGHMPMLEQPEATTSALESFLSKVGG
jgi:pimeloyl-ACP methyl ester carboxylesterase